MIYSMFAMALLTFTVAGYLLKLRVAAVRNGDVKLSSFRLNNRDDMPAALIQASRNYSNLFEMPLLFYCTVIVTVVLHLDNLFMLVLSWLFVASRLVHSWVHLTSNNVIRRMQAFMVGNLCIFLMWIILIWKYTISAY
ncbi:MAG: hypothetical protein EOO52_11930 [Gammaproteobacteria bacterium]|nr:MAG: hypothetical protein EOO52_11930 [Gammaproteobacteria bacterium]